MLNFLIEFGLKMVMPISLELLVIQSPLFAVQINKLWNFVIDFTCFSPYHKKPSLNVSVCLENGADPVVSVHILFIANINTIYATHNMLMLTQIPYYNYIIIACPFFFKHFRHIRNNIDKHKHWARLFVKITEPTTYAHTHNFSFLWLLLMVSPPPPLSNILRQLFYVNILFYNYTIYA